MSIVQPPSSIDAPGWPRSSKTAPAGRTILLRAELDALPIREQTDLAYKSNKSMIHRYRNEHPVIHACGHDMDMATIWTWLRYGHGYDMDMAALLGASALLVAAAQEWSGTLFVVFQPGEEETGGA